MQVCPGSPLGKGGPEGLRRLGVPTCNARLRKVGCAQDAHGSFERHTARPGQAHLLPSAQARSKKKKYKKKNNNKKKPINKQTKKKKNGSGNFENKCSLKPWVWHGDMALQRATVGTAGGSQAHRKVSPVGSQGAAASKVMTTMSTGRNKYMCKRHLELCRKGLPYWGQSLGLPGV